MREQLKGIDEKLTLHWSTHKLPPAWHRTLQWYTRLGDGYVWGLLLIYLFQTLPQDRIWDIVKQGFLAGGVSLVLYHTIKLTVRRPRPFAVLPQIKPEVPPLDEYSFPSGHTMNNLAPGLTLAILAPSIGWVVVIMPITWGLLRIYFGVHWFSDILAGAILGAASFGIAQLIWLFL